MGLIKALTGSTGGTLADQWKEFFYCDSIENDVLMVKGKKRTSSRSSNTKGSDNIISNGSGIAVAAGQCMIIVEQGKVVEVCAEPGEFTWDSSTEPSIFTGSLGKGILDTFKTIGKRFTYGGDTGKDQRVYYFNTKEILDNKFGTANPIPFRVVDKNIGLDIDVSVRCNGTYTYKIADPIIFYTNLAGNVENEFRRDQIDSQLKTEFISGLQPAFSKISDMEVRPNALPGHAEELCNFMNEVLTEKWLGKRGIKVEAIALNPITLPEEDAELIKQAQRTAIMRDPGMAAATLTGAQADAMKAAASNENGAMMGFMGMGMAMNTGGMNAQNLFTMSQQNQMQQNQMQQNQMQQNQMQQNQPMGGAPVQTPQQPTSGAVTWKCSCGTDNTGKFCTNCGQPQPAPQPVNSWTCACGTVNQGKFCMNCGTMKPAAAPVYKCNKCGWQPEDPTNPPKFCPECGDVFDENDAQ